jgi:glycosyltransferase involved in cell wall biosynthesis
MNHDTPGKLRIVHTEASAGWGGQEIRTFQEARWMRSRGHRVVLYAPERSEIYRRFQNEGFEVNSVRLEKRTQWFDTIKLAREFRRLKPDVVATHSSVDSWVGLLAAKAARIPVAMRYRHVSAPVRPNALNRFLYGRCSHHVLTTAECIRTQLVQQLRLDRDHVTCVPTGIDAPNFSSSRESDRRALCERLNLPGTTRFIGCVAVLRSWKGQDYLLEAFEQIAPQFPDHHLALVGEGPYRGPLESKRDQLQNARRIHFVGHQNDPWPFFRAFDIAVLPSFKDEGVPQSLLQAMFAECPVVGTKAGGIPEIVMEGQTGLLANPKSSDDLARAITAALLSGVESEARARKALTFVRERHTLDKMGEAVLGIISRYLPGQLPQNK